MRVESKTCEPLATAQVQDGSHESFIGGAFLLTLCNLISQVINYGIHIGVGRLLAPGIYGYFGIIVSIFSIIETILRWGVSKAVAFHVGRDHGKAGQILKKALQLQTVYVLTFFFLFFAFSNRLAVFLGDPGLASYLRSGAFFIIAFGFVPVYAGFLNGTGAFRKQGAMAVIRSVVKLGFIVTLLAYGMEIYGVIAAYTASTFAASLYGLWASRPNPGAGVGTVEAKNIIGFGFPLFVSGLAASLLLRMDLFMIQSLLSDRVLTGLYASASALVKAPYFLSLGTGLVVFRRIVQLRAKSPSTVRGFVSKTTYYYFLALAPIPFVLSASAEPILGLTFGDNYLPAAPVFRILSFCFVFMVFQDVLMTLITGLGRPRWSMGLSLVLLPVQFFLVYKGIFANGIAGAALATTISWALGTLIGTIYLMRGGYLTLPKWTTFVKVAIASVSSYYLALWGSPQGFWLIAFVPLLYLLYLAFVRLMGELNEGEIHALVVNSLPTRTQSLTLGKNS